MTTSVYLDYNATAPVHPEVAAALARVMAHPGNPSSVHGFGRLMRAQVEDAREAVAALVGARPAGVVFTGSGSEANNLALRGCGRERILVSAIEHESVLAAPPDAIAVPVRTDGRVSLTHLAALLARDDRPALVSVMLANNETGVIQPLREIAQLAREYGALVHCDAVQAAGRIAIDMPALGVHMLTLSAHKIGGPQGVGALILAPGVDIVRQIYGGGQERGRRAGTENVAGIVGFGVAAGLAEKGLSRATRMSALRDDLETRARLAVPGTIVHGATSPRLGNTSCLGVPDIAAETARHAPVARFRPVMFSRPWAPARTLRAAPSASVSAGPAYRRTLTGSSPLGATASAKPAAAMPQSPRRRPEAIMSNVHNSTAAPGPVTAVYLDHQATTPVDPRILDAMLPYFSERFGNPHSKHAYGREAADAVATARAQVAASIGASPREIIFTSGATEANNLAIKGAAEFHRDHGGDHIIVAATEHKCVLESARSVAAAGTRVTILPVLPNGLIDLDTLAGAIEDATALVSIMAVNNEIGVIQPLAEIGRLCRRHKILFHTDAAQAIGKIPLDVEAMGIDLLSLSGHKTYGPMGIGALYVRRRPRARLTAQISGGGQERGLRSGTLPAPPCVGLGLACELAAGEMAEESKRLAALSEHFHRRLLQAIPDVILNGDAEHRVAANLNLAFPGVDGEAILEQLHDVALSTGSACTSASVEPSYVLRALGLDDAIAAASVRIGFGRFTTQAETDFAAGRLIETVQHLKNQTPRRTSASGGV